MLAGVALVLSLPVKTFLIQVFSIPSGSMENTLQKDDRVLVDKLTPWFGAKPHRGAVVVFSAPDGWSEELPEQSSTVPRGVQKALLHRPDALRGREAPHQEGHRSRWRHDHVHGGRTGEGQRHAAEHDGQVEMVRAALEQGAQAHGFEADLCTLERAGVAVERVTGVELARASVWRLLTGRLGWSLQRPRRRAVERDDSEIARWVAQEWPRIKKGR